MKTRMEKVGRYLKEWTREWLENGFQGENGVDALNCALDLDLDRANVSKELNRLWKEGKAIKLQGKPVYYLDYDEVAQRYPRHYIPSIIAKDERITDFIRSEMGGGSHFSKQPEDESLDAMIGARGSLSEVILNAKSAVAYPPYGIDCLIIGNTGVGKTLLAHRMHNYARAVRNGQEVPFMTLYCQNYQEDSALFQEALFGSKRRGSIQYAPSIFATCRNGIIVLEQIERLPYSCQNQLGNILSQKRVHTAYQKEDLPLQTMIIATTCLPAEDARIQTLAQLLPVHLCMQDIDRRGIYEKMELIMDLFAQEARHIQTTIRVHKDIIAWFAGRQYVNNVVQMRNEIQISCSKAYLETANPRQKAVYVSYQSLSLAMRSQSEDMLDLNATILSLLSCIPNDYLQFDPDGTSSAMTVFRHAPEMFTEHRMRQFVDEFNINVNDLDDIDDYVRENISVLKDCPAPQLEAIRQNINPYVYQVTMQQLSQRRSFAGLRANVQLLYGILLHMTNYLSRIEHGGEQSTDAQVSVTREIYHEEYLCAREIYQTFGSIYDFSPSQREIDFLASYLAISNQWIDHVNVAVLLICHGERVASEMAQIARRMVAGTYYLDVIDFSASMQLNDLLELACLKVTELNQGAGVLIACDMEPLTTVGAYVHRQTRIPTRTVSAISLPEFVRIVEQSTSPLNDLDMVCAQQPQQPQPHADQKKPSAFIEQIKERVIAKTVSFIDVEKAVRILTTCLQNTLQELEIDYSDVLAIKYLCHCSNMLERVIRNESWDYPKINLFMQQHSYLLHVVEHGLEFAADAFGVKIPLTELVYVAQIFLPEE